MSGKKKRLSVTQKHWLPQTCETIFHLICPVEEDKWIPGWRDQREIIYAESGMAEPGCVFRVEHQPQLMGSATFVNSIFQPFEKIQYTGVNEYLVYQILWDLKDVKEGSRLHLTRTWTALNAEAQGFLWTLSHSETINAPDLFKYMEHYLSHGEMI